MKKAYLLLVALLSFGYGIAQSTLLTLSQENTLASFESCFNAPSNAQRVSVNGSNLTSDIIATAPSGFELSLDDLTFNDMVILTESSGSVSSSLYIRKKVGAAGSGSVVIETEGISSKSYSYWNYS